MHTIGGINTDAPYLFFLVGGSLAGASESTLRDSTNRHILLKLGGHGSLSEKILYLCHF